MKIKKAQISVEYLVVMALITLIIITILGLALFYSGAIKDEIKMNQITHSANKIISTSESVFYTGEPSQATISVYLPDNIQNIEILENDLIFTVQTNSGINKISFSSKVPILGTLPSFSGLRKMKVKAEQDNIILSLI